MSHKIKHALFLYGSLVGVAAMAPTARTHAGEWDGTVGLASQYLSRRGFQQTWGRPALQGGISYQWQNGFYAGTWMSNVNRKYLEGATVEWDQYFGYAGKAGPVSYSSTFWYYYYPGAQMSGPRVNYSYGEWVSNATWKFVTLAYWGTWTRDYFGDNNRTMGTDGSRHSRGSSYYEIDLHHDLFPGLRFDLQMGRQQVRHFKDYSFDTVGASLAYTVTPRWTLGMRYVRIYSRHRAYRHYGIGVPVNGSLHYSDPGGGHVAFTSTWSF